MNPVIKWSGSKNRQAKVLHKLEPKEQNKFLTPFVGGGAMLQYRKRQLSYAGDIISPLIHIWRFIKHYPNIVANEYKIRWLEFQKDTEYYYEVRDRFNETENSYDFLFLTRTCAGGLIRFNSKGEFNTSVHHGRPGIHPDRLHKLLKRWSRAIRHTGFLYQDYRETLWYASRGDFVFLDPPYKRTKGMYLPVDFDYNIFYEELARLNRKGANWMLTLDGVTHKGEEDSGIPRELYKRRLESKKTNSTFVKLKDMDQGTKVSDYIYLNYEE